MSCTSVGITRVGAVGLEIEIASEGIRAGLSCAGAPGVRCSRTPSGMTVTLDRDAIRARLSMVCTPSIRIPFLEIEPEAIWVYPDLESTNDVLSNTNWHIN